MKFDIYTTPESNGSPALYEIVLDDHRENAPLITTLWNRQTYEKQWLNAILALVSGAVKSCILITDIQLPSDSVGLSYWAIFKEGDLVYLQERWSMKSSGGLVGSPLEIEMHIAPRIQGTEEEHKQISEWVLPIESLQKFIDARG